MKKKEFGTLLFCALALLAIHISTAQVYAPFASYQGNYPGCTYDLGVVTTTDVIKVNLNWVMTVDYGGMTIIKLYKVSNGAATLVTIDPAHIIRPTSTSLVYEGTPS